MKKNELKIKSVLNERNIIYTNLDEFKNIISEMKRDENNE